MAGPFFKRLLRAAAIAWLIAILLFLLYELYSAWMYQTVFVGRRLGRLMDAGQGWITRGTHANAYWLTIAFDGFMLVITGAAAAAAMYFQRRETERIDRFTARPRFEKAVRQADTER